MALTPLGSDAEALPYEETLSLHDYWRVLVRRRRLILRCVAIFTVSTALILLWLPNIYQSTVALIPLGAQKNPLFATLNDLGGGAALPAGLLGKTTSSDRLLSILESRTVAINVIQYLNLLPILFASDWNNDAQQWQTDDPPTLQDAVRELGKIVSLNVNKKDVVTATVEHRDPVLAAAIANRYIMALQEALNGNAFSLAKQNRLFIAAQVDKTRQDLEQAEELLKQFEQTYKIVDIQTQTETAVKALATLEEQIISREVQLGVQQRLLKGASREVYLLEEELRGLRTQLARMYHGAPDSPLSSPISLTQNDVWIAVDAVPDIKLQYARLQRETLVQGKVLALLVQQLEQAKIDEARDETAFQVLDHAVPADRKSKPKRALIIVCTTLVGTFVGAFLAFFRESLDTTVRSRSQVERLVGLPLLATIPIQTGQRRLPRPSETAYEPVSLVLNTPHTESVRYLHTRLRHRNGQKPLQLVLLTSPEPDEETALLLVHLATIAASAGESTLLIDAHLQQATLHRLLHCLLTPGLAEGLAAPADWQQSIQHTSVPNLDLVAAGTITGPTPVTLDTPALDTLLAHYKATYNLILCTAPPLSESTDAVVLSHKVDATCLVLTSGVSHLEVILDAKNALEAVQANLTGAILTTSAPERTRAR